MSILGKSKKEPFSSKIAKEMAVEAIHKRNPALSKRKIRKVANKIDNQLDNTKKRGIKI